MKNREEATTENDFGISGDYEEEEEEECEAEVDWENEGDEAEDVKDESAASLEFLNEEAQKFGVPDDDDDDDLEEEAMLEAPLDKVEPYGMFKDALLWLQQEQPQLYQNLTKSLNTDEQAVIQNTVHQADVIAAQGASIPQTNRH